ncbi:MAG: thioredoxin family protein [Bacteroidetes bacterium]|nr:thioredoxin family protein [Bacteroidota bacterium]
MTVLFRYWLHIWRPILFKFFLLASLAGSSQVLQPVKWSFSTKNLGNQEVELVFLATIDSNWHLYSQYIDSAPPATTFTFEENPGIMRVGKVMESNALEEYDSSFKMVLKYFTEKAIFTQKIKLLVDKPLTVKGYIDFMSCDNTKCIPPADEEFEFIFDHAIKTGVTTTEKADGSQLPIAQVNTLTLADDSDTLITQQTAKRESTTLKADNIEDSHNIRMKRSLWGFFILSILAGLAAIITPCVFPMIPMTVTFFMHDNEKKKKAKFQAIIYGLSIIAIYTIIGTLVAVTLGANFANFLSTHWLPNILFFLIFMVFAASFLGAFEMTLPSWLINKADKQADKGGITAPFFMAFTLALVSFSCTGPLVGAILVESAGGQILKPIIGMLGFSLAFALPFTIFAFFPSWLGSLPKSGGWLNSVKVVLGFIELALGLKFLSIADQTYHWGILDREVYLALWIVIFTLMGFYLLGKLKFAHDSDVQHISVTRAILAIFTFSFVVYMIPGMIGAPLKKLSGYMPPQTTLDFDLNKIIRDNIKLSGGINEVSNSEICDKPKYSDILDLPHGLEGYFDYEQGLTCAKQQNKPVFIDFTGHGCVNCREMEANVWSDPKVLKRLKENYIVIALYVDDKTKIPESEWITSTYDGKVKNSVGKKYADFQITRFNVNAQPYYVLLDHKGELLTDPRAYNLNVEAFVDFLDKGIAEFKRRNGSK